MQVNLHQDIWPYVWVKSANMFGEVLEVYEDSTALVEFDEIFCHEVSPKNGYGYQADVELHDVYKFHPTMQ